MTTLRGNIVSSYSSLAPQNLRMERWSCGFRIRAVVVLLLSLDTPWRTLVVTAVDVTQESNRVSSRRRDTISIGQYDVVVVDNDLEATYFDVQAERQNCRDVRSSCSEWAAHGDCTLDPLWMHAHCPVSCRVCHDRVVSVTEKAKRVAPKTHHAAPTPYQKEVELTSFGVYPTESRHIVYDAIRHDGLGSQSVPQRLVPGHEEAIRTRLRDTIHYMQHEVMVEDRYRLVRDACQTLHPDCAFRAATTDDCDAEETEEYMLQNCAPLCWACELLHVEARCPIDPHEKHAWYPGDLNAMFEHIVSDPFYTSNYDISVLSRPNGTVAGIKANVAPLVRTGPWVMTLDNFVTPDEATTLIALGAAVGYERSTDVGDIEEDGSFERVVSTGRTSTNAWCNTDECMEDPTVVAIYERMEQLTQIAISNFEPFQLLKYEPGQFYESHHDYIDYEVTRQQGVRILTIFLYLNNVTEGGETDFPSLRLTVKPQVGRALVWPSVLDADPNAPDWRTQHQALPVLKGVKYGANVWLHQRKADECDD